MQICSNGSVGNKVTGGLRCVQAATAQLWTRVLPRFRRADRLCGSLHDRDPEPDRRGTTKAVAPNVTLTFNFASSGDTAHPDQGRRGLRRVYLCSTKQMNALGSSLGDDTEPGRSGQRWTASVICSRTRGHAGRTRTARRVCRALMTSQDKLKSGDVLLAIGSDVPVGHYAEDLRALRSGRGCAGFLRRADLRLRKGSYPQVSEGAVDCGIIYATDAFSAGLDTVDEATADMCESGHHYPATKNSTHADEAKAFLDYLTIDEAGKVFESVGFTTLA